ncbi:MAG: hypothetical protein NTY23_14120 [Chloroflexi bacterium]|nr:hypothetical protein [Chloroflexota bacterium]
MALCLLSPASLSTLEWRGQSLAWAATPASAAPVPQPTAADFDGDGSPEQLSLTAGLARVTSGDRIFWQSPAAWSVAEGLITDLNHDGKPELALLVWRPYAPWPIDRFLPHGGRLRGFHDEAGASCHLILIGWRDGRWREVWAGSALADPLLHLGAMDIDRDGIEELIALEGRYSAKRSTDAGNLTLWRWNGFGFSLDARWSGRFSQFQIVRSAEGHPLVLVQGSWR